jgi:hypothetical protein
VRVDKVKKAWGEDGGTCTIGVAGKIEGLGKVVGMVKVEL